MEGTWARCRWSPRCFIRGTGCQRLSFQARQWQINLMMKEQIHSQWAPEETEREGTEGSHLQDHNRAEYLWWAWEPQRPPLLDTKGPSAVMLPSAGSSLSMRDSASILKNQRVLQCMWHNETYSISWEPHKTTKCLLFWYWSLNNMPSCTHSGTRNATWFQRVMPFTGTGCFGQSVTACY